MKKILGLDVGGTKILACKAECGNEPAFEVGPEVKIAEHGCSLSLFLLLDQRVFEQWQMHLSDFDVICIAGAGTWNPESGCLHHADEYYGGRLEVQVALESMSVDMANVHVVNDFEAQARAAQGPPGRNAKVVLPGSGRDGHILVPGPGTGLGEAFLIWLGQEHFLLRSEGGNAPMVAAFGWQGPVIEWFAKKAKQPLRIEDMLCGDGYLALAQCLAELYVEGADSFIHGLGFNHLANADLFGEALTPQRLDVLVREGKAPALKKAWGIFVGLELRTLCMKFWGASRIVLTGGILAKCRELVLNNPDFVMALRSPHLLIPEELRQDGWRNQPVPQDEDIAQVEVVHMDDPNAGAIGACLCGIEAMGK